MFSPTDLKIHTEDLDRYEKADGDSLEQLDLEWGSRSEWTTAPEYVALGQFLSRQRDVATGVDRYRAIDFLFGQPSPAAAVPTSGSAAYDLFFSGSRSSAATDHLLDMGGRGTALVDFGTGQLRISGQTNSFNFLGDGIAGSESQGELSATGTIVAGENRFTGSFTAKAGASDTYTGDLSASFFGPAAEDIGGTLFGTSGPLYYSLAFAGYEMSATALEDTLANLKGVTRFRTVGIAIDHPAEEWQEAPLGETIIYDADTRTYTVSSRSATGHLFSFGPANRTADKDFGDLQAFGAAQPVVDGKVQYSIGLFDGEAEGVELTYASFMRVLASHSDLEGKVDRESVEYIGFGNFTPPDQLPRTGSASYAGRLFGDIDDGSKLLGSLTGRSDLTANFGAGTLSASLFPVRADAGGGSTELGRYDFTGKIDAFTAAFAASWTAGTGSLVGRFYGDAAQEYGAVFNIKDSVNGNMTGIAVGRQEAP